MVVIKGPAQVHGLRTPDTHRVAWVTSLRRRGLKPWVFLGRPVAVYVNEARLLIDCPNCGAGVSVWSAPLVALCRECGAEFTEGTLTMPDADTYEQIADILAVRKETNRNWRADESLDALVRENLDHGLPERRERVRT